MPIAKYSLEDDVFATSVYGVEWAGPDGDRLTIALLLLQPSTYSEIKRLEQS